MKTTEIINLFGSTFFVCQVLSTFCLNLRRLQHDCIQDRILEGTRFLECIDTNITVQMFKQGNQTFYCIKYEKNTGDINEPDVLSLKLYEDYHIKYVRKVYIRKYLEYLFLYNYSRRGQTLSLIMT